jgi:hypothetical protein
VALGAASVAWLVSSCLLYIAVEVLLRRRARAKES